MYQLFIVEITFTTGKVGDGPSNDYGYHATNEGIVHVSYGVELCQQISVKEKKCINFF